MADQDIERIKAKHAETVAKRAAQENADKERVREVEARASKATEDWTVVWNRVQAIVSAIDSDIREVGLELKCQLIDRSDTPAIAQVEISLLGPPKEKRLILNVSKFGMVQPVVLIPHSGRAVGNFDLTDASNERIKAEIINFLDQAV